MGGSHFLVRINFIFSDILLDMHSFPSLFICIPCWVKCSLSKFVSKFVIGNQNNFHSGLEVHGLNTRSKNQLYLPILNLSVFQKGTTFTGIRLFNSLPRTIQSLRNDRTSFKNHLFSYLMNNSFYTVAEFLEHTVNN
jgi:hypothetical protein